MECVFAFHCLDALRETISQLVKISREREAGVYGAAVGGVTGVEEIAIPVPMFDGEMRQAVGFGEMHSVLEPSLEQGAPWRLGIPGHQDGRRDGLWVTDDVQALWGSISEEVCLETLELLMMNGPVGGCQVLKGSPHDHRRTVPWLL